MMRESEQWFVALLVVLLMMISVIAMKNIVHTHGHKVSKLLHEIKSCIIRLGLQFACSEPSIDELRSADFVDTVKFIL